MDVRHEPQIELFRALPVEEIVEKRELHGSIGSSFLGEVLFLIYASGGNVT